MQRLRELSGQVLAVFDALSAEYSKYQQDRQLPCPPQCGACCNKPDIEVTVLEMLPLALHLFDQGRAEEVVESLPKESGFACQFFQRFSLDGNRGRCTVYPFRPGVCRMFGVGGYTTKNGAATLSVCGQLKSAMPQRYAEAVILASQHRPPMLAEGQSRLSQLDYQLGSERLPINQAVAKALQHVLTQAYYYNEEDNDIGAPIIAA